MQHSIQKSTVDLATTIYGISSDTVQGVGQCISLAHFVNQLNICLFYRHNCLYLGLNIDLLN